MLHWKAFNLDRKEGSRRIDFTPSGVVKLMPSSWTQKQKRTAEEKSW